ncbi:MAG: DUF1840 domain-containing protein [Spongiibacteraceae bacterium]
MLITFKSTASANVVTFEETAQQMLSVIDNNLSTAEGIITVEQLPAAISKIKAKIAQDKLTAQQQDSAEEEGEEVESEPNVSFSQRAFPFLALLESALEEELPVVWGV